MAFAAPVIEVFAIARRGLGARKVDEVAGVDPMLGAEFKRRRIAAHHPERRMRLLQGLHREQRAVGLVVVAMERERLLLAIGRAQIADELEGRRFPEIVVDAERGEVSGRDARYEPAFETAAEHLVDDGDLFGEPQRMMEWHDIAHRADPQPLGACATADRIERRR
jgi:hypothetical protein